MSLSCHPVFLNNYTPFSFLTLKPETVIPSSRVGSRVFSVLGGGGGGVGMPIHSERRKG